jgi:hypothetical protein
VSVLDSFKKEDDYGEAELMDMASCPGEACSDGAAPRRPRWPHAHAEGWDMVKWWIERKHGRLGDLILASNQWPRKSDRRLRLGAADQKPPAAHPESRLGCFFSYSFFLPSRQLCPHDDRCKSSVTFVRVLQRVFEAVHF